MLDQQKQALTSCEHFLIPAPKTLQLVSVRTQHCTSGLQDTVGEVEEQQSVRYRGMPKLLGKNYYLASESQTSVA